MSTVLDKLQARFKELQAVIDNLRAEIGKIENGILAAASEASGLEYAISALAEADSADTASASSEGLGYTRLGLGVPSQRPPPAPPPQSDRRPRRNVRSLILDAIRAAGAKGATPEQLVDRVPGITTDSVRLAVQWYTDPRHGPEIVVASGKLYVSKHAPGMNSAAPTSLRRTAPAVPAPGKPTELPIAREPAFGDDDETESMEPSTEDLQACRALLLSYGAAGCKEVDLRSRDDFPWSAVQRGLDEGWITAEPPADFDEPIFYRYRPPVQTEGMRLAAEGCPTQVFADGR